MSNLCGMRARVATSKAARTRRVQSGTSLSTAALSTAAQSVDVKEERRASVLSHAEACSGPDCLAQCECRPRQQHAQCCGVCGRMHQV